MSNKKGRFKPKHIDIFGTRFCMPKGMRGLINKLNPELKGKNLSIANLPKVSTIISTKEIETDKSLMKNKKKRIRKDIDKMYEYFGGRWPNEAKLEEYIKKFPD